jgi:hypothetical protein
MRLATPLLLGLPESSPEQPRGGLYLPVHTSIVARRAIAPPSDDLARISLPFRGMTREFREILPESPQIHAMIAKLIWI